MSAATEYDVRSNGTRTSPPVRSSGADRILRTGGTAAGFAEMKDPNPFEAPFEGLCR